MSRFSARLLPDEDKRGQIQKLTTQYIQKRFKTTPRGIVAGAERVCGKPGCRRCLRESGIRLHA